MSNEFSSFNRPPGQGEVVRGRASGGPNQLLLLGGAVVLAAMLGGGVVYFLTSQSGAPTQAAGNNAPQAARPAGQGQAPGANQGAPGAPVQWTTAGTFGSWQVRCQNGNAAAKLCTAVLEVVDNKSKQVLMAWIVGPDPKGGLQTVFQTPSGVLVGNGVDIKIANAATRHLNYMSCMPQQCTAVAPMDEAFVKETLAAPKADVTVYAANGKAVAFGIPVTGFDKALAAIRK